jgi:hypothetical protein
MAATSSQTDLNTPLLKQTKPTEDEVSAYGSPSTDPAAAKYSLQATARATDIPAPEDNPVTYRRLESILKPASTSSAIWCKSSTSPAPWWILRARVGFCGEYFLLQLTGASLPDEKQAKGDRLQRSQRVQH